MRCLLPLTLPLILALFLALVSVSLVAAPLARGPVRQGPSGLDVPRFVAIAQTRAYLRSGPGERYPIRWEYRREGLPLLVVGEYGAWRQVRDPEGTEGWMHVALLSGTRTVWLEQDAEMKKDPDRAAAPVLRAEAGVTATLDHCQAGWCRLKLAGRTGWLPAAHLWGVFQEES